MWRLLALCWVAAAFLPAAPRHHHSVVARSAVGTISSPVEFDRLVRKQRTVVVDFGNTFCTPCKTMAPQYERIADEFSDAAFFNCHVDASAGATALGKREGVRIVPTFHVYHRGERLDVVEGVKPEALRAAVGRAAGASFWAAPLARARWTLRKFGPRGSLRELVRTWARRLLGRRPKANHCDRCANEP